MNTGLRTEPLSPTALRRSWSGATAALVALFVWTLAATLWRTHRLPNDYAEAQWLLTWEFGFVKRGLPGTLLSWFASLTSTRVTPALIAAVALAIFGAYCVAMLLVAVRIARRSEWSAGAVIAGLVFFSSPFLVEQMDVVGYYDVLVLLIGVVSVLLVARDRPWSAAMLQGAALLVHEQSLVLGYPAVVFCTLVRHRHARPTHRWQNWFALLLPIAASVALAFVWHVTTTPDVIASYTAHLKQVGFVGEMRDVWAPEWLFRSFTESFTAERPMFLDRLADVRMLRVVLPSVLGLFCFALEAFAIPIFSIEALGFAAVCLAPQAMHLVAWDTVRIWTYSSATAFLAASICSEYIRPRRGMVGAGTLVGVWALLVHVFTRTPLLDVPSEAWLPAMRAATYALPLIASLAMIARHGSSRRRPPAPDDGLLSPGRSEGWDIMKPLMDGGDRSPYSMHAATRVAIVIGFLLFIIVVVRTAWLGDDAYITFRSVDNLIHGYGLRWNTIERVQPFTHPLWALLLVGPFALTGEAYFTSLAVSMLLAFAAVWLFIRRIASSPRAAVVALAVFVFSKAFVEYATSGLENPLTTFLLTAFLAVYWAAGFRRIVLLWTLGGLLMLNRLDLALLALPVLVAESMRTPWRRTMGAATIGLLPLAAWEIFSLVYYGFLFPNTAYAKLQTGVGSGELMGQGLLYFLESIQSDPVTLLAIAAGLVICLQERRRGDWPVAIGMALYLTYIVRIGGDFMSGRFFVAPLVFATGLLCRRDWDLRAPVVAPLTATIALLGTFATVRPPITSTMNTYITTDAQGMGVGAVADERAYYYRYTGLMRWTREVPLPHESLMVDAARAMRGSHEVMATRNIGLFGYFAGPTVHIVDLMALTDPLLARLPSIRPWRIGHFERRVPDGYLESIRSGKNQIVDLAIAQQYEQLKLVTQGPLWDRRRWRAIRRLNLNW
jgi:arabinofuranosyltransferase